MIRPRSSIRFLSNLALILICALNACAFQRHEVRDLSQEAAASILSRVQTVAFPLLLASAEWCPFDQEPIYGFVIQDKLVVSLQNKLESRKDIVIAHVYDRSPAAMAGLRIGDQVIRINTLDVSKQYASAASNLVRRLTQARVQPLQLDVARSGQHLRIYLNSVPSCQFTLEILQTDIINAVSNGRQIAVTTGLMRFVQSDDELAWVLAHEIAHNVLHHVSDARLRVMLNAWLGATVGDAALPAPPPRSLEANADYVGVYFMARARYDLQAVRRLWQRLGEMESPQTASFQGIEHSHPTTQERLAAFDATLKEIEGKRARREALDPLIGHVER